MEWANRPYDDLESCVKKKCDRVEKLLDRNDFCKLILLDGENLVGFISIFPYDCDERLDLTPWYATMYVKKEYRGNGYSKLLNDAIIVEAMKRGFDRIYLKTDLINYYEKFGFKYVENINDKEKLYVREL